MDRQLNRGPAALTAALLAISLPFGGAAGASAAEKVLYAFTDGSDGGGPQASLVFDPAGNLYGTTHFGGITSCGGQVGGGCGVVFELTPSHNAWTESVLYAFGDGADGGFPNSAVILDKAGNVYGTASTGGSTACSIGCGVAYELRKSGKTWAEYVLHTFTGSDGQFPNAALYPGKSGSLYGTTWYGGASGNGAVFELIPHGKTWAETVLLSLPGGAGGTSPAAGVFAGPSGDLFGTTYPYNGSNDGVVYELKRAKPPELVLHSFGSGDGQNPYAGLIADSKGNLYGTTIEGGTSGVGTVYELLRPKHGGVWIETILYSFSGVDGSQPYAGLLMDRKGDLFGTTVFGGPANYGTVFELTPAHGTWSERVLYAFTGGADGANPAAALIFDSKADLYGTTENGGANGYGVVFELTP